MISKYRLPKFESMFQPTTSVFENNVTYIEFLTGVLCRLNEIIDLVNKHEEFIESYAGKIEEIEAEMAQLQKDFYNYKQELNEEIDSRLVEIQNSLNAQIASATSYMRAYTDAKAQELQQNIDNIAVGQISVYNPTTGQMQPLQIVINDLYDSGRSKAITATEYDALELTATAYDALQISAYDFDQNGKELLTQ